MISLYGWAPATFPERRSPVPPGMSLLQPTAIRSSVPWVVSSLRTAFASARRGVTRNTRSIRLVSYGLATSAYWQIPASLN